MKYFFIIWILGVLLACSEQSASRQTEFDRNMFCSSEEAKQAICEMKQYCKAVVVATKGRNVDSSDCRNPDRTILEASEERLSLLPYCYFDIDEFYAHPSPEKIAGCLKRSVDELWFSGVLGEDGSTFRVCAKKKENNWRWSYITEEWGERLDWLSEKSEEMGSCNYLLFQVAGQEFIAFYKENRWIYFDLFGNEKQPAEFAEILFNLIKMLKNWQGTPAV